LQKKQPVDLVLQTILTEMGLPSHTWLSEFATAFYIHQKTGSQCLTHSHFIVIFGSCLQAVFVEAIKCALRFTDCLPNLIPSPLPNFHHL